MACKILIHFRLLFGISRITLLMMHSLKNPMFPVEKINEGKGSKNRRKEQYINFKLFGQ